MRERIDGYFLRGCFADADVEADPGTGGSKFRVDDDGTRAWPYAKLAWGASGTQTHVAAGAGALPIQDGGNSITVDGTVTANAGTNLNTSTLALEAGGNLAAAATSLAVMDDWDESDRAKVNIIAGQAGVAAGTGTDGATVQRVTLATNVPLPAGTNALGSVTQNASTTGGWTPHSHLSDGTNQDSEIVKAAPGQLGFVYASNINAAPAYIKFYDQSASAEETDTPVLRLLIPGNAAGAGGALAPDVGIAFNVGICYRITTGVADASSAGAAANEVIINLGHK